LLALAAALLAIALLAPAGARPPVAVPVRVPARAVRLAARLGRPVRCDLPGCGRLAARRAWLRR
jgi:hypothetical protein